MRNQLLEKQLPQAATAPDGHQAPAPPSTVPGESRLAGPGTAADPARSPSGPQRTGPYYLSPCSIVSERRCALGVVAGRAHDAAAD